MRIPDNYDAWCEYDRRQQIKLDKLPTCAWCGSKIQTEEAYAINDKLVCRDCIDNCKVYLDEDGEVYA